MIRKFLFFLVLDGPYLGPLAPWILGLALGSRPHKLVRQWIDEANKKEVNRRKKNARKRTEPTKNSD